MSEPFNYQEEIDNLKAEAKTLRHAALWLADKLGDRQDCDLCDINDRCVGSGRGCAEMLVELALSEAKIQLLPCPDPDDKTGICAAHGSGKGDCIECIRDWPRWANRAQP